MAGLKGGFMKREITSALAVLFLISFSGSPFAGDSVMSVVNLSGINAAAIGGGKCSYKRQEFLSSGTFTVPSGVAVLSLTGCAGGGGGSNGISFGNGGSGGGSGQGVINFPCPVTAGTTYTVTIGPGGSAGVYGLQGGATSFGSCLSPLAGGGGGNNPVFGGIGGGGGGKEYANYPWSDSTPLYKYNADCMVFADNVSNWGCGGTAKLNSTGLYYNYPGADSRQIGYSVFGSGGGAGYFTGASSPSPTDGGKSIYPGGTAGVAVSAYGGGGGGGGMFGKGGNYSQSAGANSCAGGGGGNSGGSGGNGGSGRLVIEWCE